MQEDQSPSQRLGADSLATNQGNPVQNEYPVRRHLEHTKEIDSLAYLLSSNGANMKLEDAGSVPKCVTVLSTSHRPS